MPAPYATPSLPAAPRDGLVYQILLTPWLSLMLMCSGLFLLGMIALSTWSQHGLLAMWRMQRELATFAAEIGEIEQDNTDLRHEIQRLHNDLPYLEKIAREELGLVKKGEIVFEFVDQER